MSYLCYVQALQQSAPAPPPPPSPADMPASKPASSEPRVGFMSLPLELRFEIYSLLLSIPPRPKSSSSSSSRRHLSSKAPPPTRVHPAILLASRQINFEATPFLYSSNMFVAHPKLLAEFPRLRNWYPPLREAKTLAPYIHRFHVQVRLDQPLPYDRAAVSRSFSGVDELSIDVVQSMFLGVGGDNLRVFDEVRGVKRVYISGSTTGLEDYVDWLKYAMTCPVGAEVVPFEELSESPWAHIWSGHDSLVRSSTGLVEKEE